MDSSVALGAGLWLLGVACVVIQVRWARSEKRKLEEAVAAAEAAGEEPPDPGPDPWEHLPVQRRL